METLRAAGRGGARPAARARPDTRQVTLRRGIAGRNGLRQTGETVQRRSRGLARSEGFLAGAIKASATPERTDRLFPGDPAQFTHDGLGLAYGAAGVLWALHTVGAPVAGDHIEWLLEAVARRPCRPGLYTGAHGVAFTLDQLGCTRQAHNLLDRLLKEPLDALGSDLAGGLPGIGLTLLHFAGTMSDASLQATALDVAQRLAARLPADAAVAASGTRPGLLHGPLRRGPVLPEPVRQHP